MRPHADRQSGHGRGRQRQREDGGAGALGLAVILLLLALAAAGLLGSPLAIDGAHAAPLAVNPPATYTPTDTPTVAPPTATPTPPPPTLTLVSPTVQQGQSSAQGPSGANVTIRGANFTVTQVSIFASQQATCATQTTTLASVATTNGAFPAETFVWPTLPARQYYICGTGMSANAPGFYEVTSQPPTLALSTAAVQPGQMVTITGSNFFGASPVNVTLQSGSTVQTIKSSVKPDSHGSFTIQYSPDTSLAGDVQIEATSPSSNGATPALTASVYLNVVAGSTATVGTTPSPQSTSTPKTSGAAPPTSTNDDHTGLLAFIAAIVLGLLIVLGVLAFFIVRRRAGGGPALGYSGGGAGPGGYGGFTGGVPTAYGPRQTGRPAGLDPGTDGNAYGQGMRVGAVAQWEDDSRPGPDWQPRPMSGRRRYEETPIPAYGDDYPTDASRYAEAAGYDQDDYRPEDAPPDPWADPAEADDRYGGRGATNPANYPDEEWTQVQPRREADAADWHNEPGPGTTRPDGMAEDGAEETTRRSAIESTANTELHGDA